ncbi:MAG: hypothetical protein J5680_06390 [Neisseriaceae bacterium]|nr:hypothetical protein [Neisseriaceae bacterium]
MSVSVEDFLSECNQTKPRSQIEPFKADIQALLQAGVSVPKVQSFLERNGVKVSLRAIYQYIERHHLKNDDEPKQEKKTEKSSLDLPVKKSQPKTVKGDKQTPRKTPVVSNSNSNGGSFKISDKTLEELLQ